MEIAVGGRRTASAGCDDGAPSGASAVSIIIERSRVLYHVLFSQSLNQARPLPPTNVLQLFLELTGVKHRCTFFQPHCLLIFSPLFAGRHHLCSAVNLLRFASMTISPKTMFGIKMSGHHVLGISRDALTLPLCGLGGFFSHTIGAWC